jgi:hypothetical protein
MAGAIGNANVNHIAPDAVGGFLQVLLLLHNGAR